MAPAISAPGSPQPEASDVDEEIITSGGTAEAYKLVLTEPSVMIPDIFTRPPLVRDVLQTDTSEVQDETVQLCLPFMDGAGQDGLSNYNDFGLPKLDRPRHIRFLKASLETLPGTFVGYDASRPWLLYWCLNGLTLLGEDVTSYRQRLVDTAKSMQNVTGGFGGGHGQASHLATTYAVVLSLAIIGGKDCYDAIDRRGLWEWLCALKQPNGGFQMSIGAEVDVRGAYCAAVLISILNLPLGLSTESPAWTPNNPTLFTGLAEYVQRYLDVQRLVSWLSSRQYAPEGGFSGRTNKLVDGCYSHWVGDCWPLVEACLGRSKHVKTALPSQSLFSREGLIRYILCCCQDQTKRGGLRDKPGRMSDPYHTCYVLSGLSSAQHKWELVAPEEEPALSTGGADVSADSTWSVSPFMGGDLQVFDEADRVNTLHPVYSIPADCVSQIQGFFRAKQGF